MIENNEYDICVERKIPLDSAADKEERCFNRIRAELFTSKTLPAPEEGSRPIVDFEKKIIEEKTRERLYFGFRMGPDGFQEVADFEARIAEAKRNSDSKTVFPDFTTEEGFFFEHFCITSGKENKKGSQNMRNRTEQKKDAKEKIKEQFEKDKTIRSATETYLIDEQSLEYLQNSFERNWKNHIISMNKSGKAKGAFIIETDMPVLDMWADKARPYNNMDIAKRIYGANIGREEYIGSYSLVHDKKLIGFIKGYEKHIKYVIFLYGNKMEIINVEGIKFFEDNISPNMMTYQRPAVEGFSAVKG